MAYTPTEADIELLRKAAFAAEPFTGEECDALPFDGEWTLEEDLRFRATAARQALEEAGVPLEK